CQHYYSTPSSF
nr:immunoglobulin light chain junction region [Macaca mulatta]MPN90840.1 immunoglobulin light chain junction region [Macaca mulatta]MPN90918.1 immunoglobulin light chain junction region [Macaca mulatta]MPN90966.1 immunoglobulin light chain junction region [Macaca mulatta]MPN90983.1 immunoglobulin light chain junction region [Macaca mulatta]